MVVLGAGTAVISSQSDPTLSDFLGAAVLPLPLLLPIIAILLVTGDWTQRGAMTTFALVPRRSIVLAARALAAMIVVVATMVVLTVLSAVAFLLVHPQNLPRTDWSDLRETLWSILAISLAAALSGVAMGSLLLITPLAIVVTMIVPITYELAIGARFPGIAPWVSSLAFSTWLADPQWSWLASSDTTTGLGPALCSLALWTALPLSVGWFRQLRKEVA
ncbi:hypothetical protein AX769_19755 [Frondihabitans sp. PAMC 28766]|uniref:hypothetical protein n=1 Tax=Frondihabitans sp. PAMC 28766 TaxID=1795630 RepID=UPI00078BE3BE|nr:hypothetical protein [Frondihabitans sp. PAMC 28766]AMM21970.1 hypothetical protein AX769_19755 [Frondihabitans sp. PAMC 28766]